MNEEMVQEVWGMVDREHLAQVARKGPEPIFATISGAHLYGFASPDSDVDLRGAFMLPVRDLLGLQFRATRIQEPDAPQLLVTGVTLNHARVVASQCCAT